MTERYLIFNISTNSLVTMFKMLEIPFITTFLGEIVVLAVLWLFWIIGAGIASVRLLLLFDQYY
jgi:hypothetical protein